MKNMVRLSNCQYMIIQLFFCSFCLSSCLSNKSSKALVQEGNKQSSDLMQRLSKKQLSEWQDLQYGMFLCYGMETFTAEGIAKTFNINSYNPSNLDVAQWVRVAKDAGMTYAVITAKHVSGHCLWPSKYTEFDVSNSDDTTDVVGKFVEECRKQDIKPGIYYCAWDEYHVYGSKTFSSAINANNAMRIPTDTQPLSDAPYTTHLYQNFMTAQIDELVDNYGPLVEFWIDIPIVLGDGYRTYLYNHLASKDPNMVIIANNGSQPDCNNPEFKVHISWPSDAMTLEQCVPDHYDPLMIIGEKMIFMPGETCYTLGKKWFWSETDQYRSEGELRSALATSLNNKVNFLLSVPPDTTGRIPIQSIKLLENLKETLDNYNN